MSAIARPHTWIAAALTAALAAAVAPAADAAKLDSFAGSCAIEATVFFDPPATNFQQPLSVRDTGNGRCTGTLNGRAVSDAPVTIEAAFERVDGSCVRARTTRPGRGSITFDDGTSIRFAIEFDFVGTEGEITFRGERSGSARGRGSFATQRTPPDIPLQCAGEGVREAPLDIAFTTESPLVTRHRAGAGASPRPRSGPGGKRLRVRVRPRSVEAGRRTAFRFRVRTAGGRALCGAVIRFAGRRVRTNRRGRAKIVVRLPRPGRWTARARARGFRTGRAHVEAHDRPGGDGAGRAVSFSGSCEFAGQVAFRPPLTNEPRPVDQAVEAPGTCSGTFVDRSGRAHELEEAPATYVATGHDDMASCGRGSATGGGALVFGDDELDFTLSETRAGGTVAASLTGRRGGSATAIGAVSRSEDPVAILGRCAGPGIEEVGLEGQLTADGLSG